MEEAEHELPAQEIEILLRRHAEFRAAEDEDGPPIGEPLSSVPAEFG